MNMFKESISMAISNITHNRMRTFLTTLGIVIGVTAIIALITVVQSVTGEMTSRFTTLGAGKVMVSASGTALKRGLTAGDLEALLAVDNVAGISPSVSLSLSMQSASGWDKAISVEGKNELFFQNDDSLIARGRPLNRLDVENNNRVCLIDEPLMRKLFPGIDPLGQTLTIGGIEHIVIGVLSDSGNSDLMRQMQGGNDDGRAIVPYTDALKLSGQQTITSLEVYISDTVRTEETIIALEHALDAAFNYKEDSYKLINMQSLLDTMNTMLAMMTAMLAGIASISLLVGGIGIMNMMLVSVTERTHEIGLRKALGAQPGQIQEQFLIESFTLSLLGGLIGAILGVGSSALICMAVGSVFAISWMAVSLGVVFSAAVGIIFGWAPARNASNLNPIDALRSA
jgi:putative ABC transport system permease protein